MKNKIKTILFGERIKGEKLPPLKPLKERPMNDKDFFKWCNELNVSSQYGRQNVHIDNFKING